MKLFNLLTAGIGLISIVAGTLLMKHNVMVKFAFFLELFGLMVIIGSITDTDATVLNAVIGKFGLHV